MGQNIDKFSEEVISKLGFYVYALIDPREESYGVFYIGKGQGNRVFDHARGKRSKQEDSEEEDSEKITIINDIQKSGQKVKYYILRDGLDEPTAFTVESTLIDLLTYNSFKGQTLGHLSNIQSGHHQKVNGIKTVEEVEEFYGAKEVDLSQYIKEGSNFIAIKLNPDQVKVKDEADLYKRTHFCWKVSKERANNCHYALAVTNGIIREVYPCYHAWSDTTLKEVKEIGIDQDIYRKCFDKEKADNKDSAQLQELKDTLIGKRIKGLHKAQNAIAYFDSQKLETTK